MSGNDNSGFTLLEILLAISILAIVSAMVGYAIDGSVAGLEITGNRKDVYRQARVALNRINDDLAGVVPGSDFTGKSLEIEGRSSDFLGFESTAHITFSPSGPQTGVARISYRVVADRDNQQLFKLIRADTLAAPQSEQKEEPTEGFILCEDLKSVSFTYVGQDGQKVDTWETEEEVEEEGDKILPRLVYVSLEFFLDQEQGTTMIFDSAVWLPAGWIQPGGKDNET